MGSKSKLTHSVVALAVMAFAVGSFADDSTPGEAEAKAATKAVEAGGAGMATLERAAKGGKYSFIFFFRLHDTRTKEMRKVFDETMVKLADRAESVAVRVDAAAEQAIVEKFAVGKAPMPFVFSVASNGAIVQSFRNTLTEQQLTDAFVSRSTERCLKALQDGKLVLMSVRSAETTYNDEAMKGVLAFKADGEYALNTEIITIDPSKEDEAKFLKNFKVDPKTTQAVTVFLAPPGKVLGTYTGATDKKTLVAALTASGKKPCCPGKPGGCKPKKKG